MASELTQESATALLDKIFQRPVSFKVPGTLHGDLLDAANPVESIVTPKDSFGAGGTSAGFSQPTVAGSTWSAYNAGPYNIGNGSPGDYDWVGLCEGFGTNAPNTLFTWLAEFTSAGTNPPSGTAFATGEFSLDFQGHPTPPAAGRFYPTEELARDLLHYLLQNHIAVATYVLQASNNWTIKLHDASTGLAGSAHTYSWSNGAASAPVSGAAGTYIQNTSPLVITNNSGGGATSYLASTNNPIKFVSIEVNGRRYWSMELASPVDVPAGSTITIPTGGLNVGFGHLF